MMLSSSHDFWEYAVDTANFIHNRLPHCKEFRRNRLQITKYTKQFKTRNKNSFLINNLLLILKINLLLLLAIESQ